MRGVKRSVKYDNIVKSFCENQEELAGKAVFSTMREFMCFAAVLGFQYEKRVPFSPKEKTFEIDGRIFANHPTTVDLLHLIALAVEKKVDILRDENENDVVGIFEEYANGGFQIIESWLKKKPDDSIGHQALMVALKEDGFLDKNVAMDDALGKVSF
jgi:dnd system-associated protein 4